MIPQHIDASEFIHRSPGHHARTLLILLLPCALVLSHVGPVFAQPDASQVDDATFHAVRDEDYRELLNRIEKSLRFAHGHDQVISLLFQKGEVASSLGQHATALEAYADIVRRQTAPGDPDSLLARMYQAEVYGIEGRYTRAMATYGQVVAQANASTPEHRIYGQTAKDRIARIDRLRQYLQQSERTTRPDEQAALTFAISELYENIKAFDAAVREFTIFIARDPSHERAPEAQYRIGQIFARRGAFRRASEAYERVVAEYPASRFDTFSLFQLGRLYIAQKETARALGMFERMLEERPVRFKLGETYYMRALCLERLGRLDEAVDGYRLFIDRALSKGLILTPSDIGRTETDVASLRAALEVKIQDLLRQHPARLLARAKSRMEEGPYDGAAKTLRRLLSHYRGTPEAEEGTGLLQKAEALAEADWQLRVAESTENSPTRARAYFNAASVYDEMLEDYEHAILLFRRVAEMNADAGPWGPRALLRVGTIYSFRLDDETRGLEAFRRVVSEAPSSGEAARAYLQIGEVLLRSNVDDAIQAWQRVLAVSTVGRRPGSVYADDPADRAAFRIARVLYDRERYRDAVEALRDYVRTRPESPRIAAAWLFMSRIYEALDEHGYAADAVKEAMHLAQEGASYMQWILREFPPGVEASDVLEWMHGRLGALIEGGPLPVSPTADR